MKTITLKTPSMGGKIYVGEDVIENRLPILTQGQKNFIITDSNVYALYKNWFERYFPSMEIFVLTAGEENKNFHSLYAILEKMAGAGLRRNDRLFAVGGGVVGDIGGLAAALYMRGISCVQIPTTLLAQVDSSVGGKTAVDLGGVKNVVGAFYQPCEVLIDPTFLKTLSLREIKCGVGEIVKYCALNREIFECVESEKSRLGDLEFLQTLIYPCVLHKARVVERDEKESGERRSLNVGHTTGHAIEISNHLSHGESVLYGMYLETKLAMERGMCEMSYGERLLSIIESALAIFPKTKVNFSKIGEDAQKARLDKKNVDNEKIVVTAAKSLGEWGIISLPFKEYQSGLERLVKSLPEV